MKNKGIIISLSLIVLSLIAITIHGGPISYVFFLTAVLTPLSSLLYIFYVYHSLKIYQKAEGRDMVADTPTDFYITFHNEGWISFSSVRVSFYSSFSKISEIDEDVTYELPPHSSISKKTGIVCFYRGEYKVGIKQITVKDPLNIFEITYRVREPLNVIVVPRIVRISEASGKEMFTDTNRENLLNKTEPDIPVREYAPGDDIRFLNWKASAVMQKYMVREKRGEEKNGIAVVLDPGRYLKEETDYLPVENRAVTFALSLALFYMENNVPVDVILRDKSVCKCPVLNMGDFDDLYEKICRYRFDDEKDMSSFSLELREERGLFGYRMIVFVLLGLGDKEIECIDIINTDHVPVRIYLISPDDEREAFDIAGGKADVVMLKADPGKEGHYDS